MFIKPAVSVEATRGHVQKICEGFNEKIEKAVTAEEKLYAIVECVWYLEHSHVFTDANLRTSVFLIMNKLLLQNGFSPVLADDPNIIDGRSKEEVVQCIKQWQVAYKAMVEKSPITAAASTSPADANAANQVNAPGVSVAGSVGLFSAEETQRRASAAAAAGQANKSSVGQIDASKMSSAGIRGRFGKR